MPDLIELQDVALIPVIELEPLKFATKERVLPSDADEDWDEYWRASLADSGLTGINPICSRSWHVPAATIAPPHLETILEAIIKDEDSQSGLSEVWTASALYGGLAVVTPANGVVVLPSCCGDLSNIWSWKEAALYRRREWEMLWIGHPWLSMKFEQSRLVISEPHESNDPIERWSVDVDELSDAVAEAKVELQRFAAQIASILERWKYSTESSTVSRTLAGLVSKSTSENQ